MELISAMACRLQEVPKCSFLSVILKSNSAPYRLVDVLARPPLRRFGL